MQKTDLDLSEILTEWLAFGFALRSARIELQLLKAGLGITREDGGAF